MRSLDPSGEGVIKADVIFKFVDSKGEKHEVSFVEKVGLIDYDAKNKMWRPQSVMDKDYGLVQRDELFLFMDTVIGMVDGSHYDAAVNLRKGRQIVLSAYIGEYALDPKGRNDRQQRYIWGFSSFDGSWALRLKKGEYRVECANMAAMALRGSTDQDVIGCDWSTRHTKDVMQRVNEAKTVLQMWNVHDRLFEAQAEHMIQCALNDNAFGRIIEGLYTDINPKTNQRETDKEAVEAVRMNLAIGRSTKDIADTVWGGFNAVTEYEDWLVKVRGGKNSSVNEKRLVRQLEDPDGRKQAAWDRFWDLAETSKPFKMPSLA
jgi:hypothetical protein